MRMVEYEVPDRDGDGKGEVIALVTTITEMTAAPAPLLAEAYSQRWEQETGNAQLKTYLSGPGRVLRSRSPDMVRQEIYGYLLTHYALSALICRAATEAGIDPDRVKFKRTVRIVRRRPGTADPAAFPLNGKRVTPPAEASIGASRQRMPESSSSISTLRFRADELLAVTSASASGAGRFQQPLHTALTDRVSQCQRLEQRPANELPHQLVHVNYVADSRLPRCAKCLVAGRVYPRRLSLKRIDNKINFSLILGFDN